MVCEHEARDSVRYRSVCTSSLRDDKGLLETLDPPTACTNSKLLPSLVVVDSGVFDRFFCGSMPFSRPQVVTQISYTVRQSGSSPCRVRCKALQLSTSRPVFPKIARIN